MDCHLCASCDQFHWYLGGDVDIRLACQIQKDLNAMEEKRKELIEYAKWHLCDLVPYNEEDYNERLQALAEAYADEILQPSKNRSTPNIILCEPNF